MTTLQAALWGLAILAVALLNILDVLPDWTTFAAILTLPLAAVISGGRCLPRSDRTQA